MCLRVTGSAPSFEQMGMAIQELIREDNLSDVNSDASDSFSLTCEHQMLMSWAWISIKVRTVHGFCY